MQRRTSLRASASNAARKQVLRHNNISVLRRAVMAALVVVAGNGILVAAHMGDAADDAGAAHTPTAADCAADPCAVNNAGSSKLQAGRISRVGVGDAARATA